MGFRETINNILFKKEIERVESLVSALEEASRQPYLLTNESLYRQLKEVDSNFADFVVRMMRYSDSSSLSNVYMSEEARKASVNDSRTMFVWDAVVQTIIGLWTDFGFGTRVDITPVDEQGRKVWSEFWSAARNRHILGERNIHNLSNQLLTDGELFVTVFASRIDGLCTIGVVKTEEITEILYDPDSSLFPVLFKRMWTTDKHESRTMYYRNWLASEEQVERVVKYYELDNALLAHNIYAGDTGTDVVMMQVAFRPYNGRGYPLMTAGIAWARVYKQFLQDRTAVSKAVATFVDKLRIKGGSRAIETVKLRLQSALTGANTFLDTNPPPAAGSEWVENESIVRERMPLGTSAGDAEKDGSMFIGQAGLAGRIYPHYLGYGPTYRLATATAMEKPVFRAFNAYQLFWSSVWEDLVSIVFMMAEKYSSVKIRTYEVKINLDRIINLDIEQIATLMNSVNACAINAVIPQETAAKIIVELSKAGMDAVGVTDVGNIFNEDEMMKQIAKNQKNDDEIDNPPSTQEGVGKEYEDFFMRQFQIGQKRFIHNRL